MMHGRADCKVQRVPVRGTSTWDDSHTEVTSGSGLVRVTTINHEVDADPHYALYTAEEAGRLALSLLAAAREEGWKL